MPHIPSEERRRQVMAAACVVISGEGLERATTRRIADEAGAPLASLHYTFRNKEELLAGVCEYLVEQARERVLVLVPAGCGLETGVRTLMSAYFESMVADSFDGTAVHELLMWGLRVPSAREISANLYESVRRVYFDALAQAAAGQAASDMLEDLSGYIFCALDGVLVQYLAVGDAESSRRHLEQFIKLAVDLARQGGYDTLTGAPS